ncbi:hypothetical protein CFC21_095055 [Triticum aestivum]|uniref:LRR receptor-like serine/threonine-protein kinase HSL2 n=5 Tax=Triticum TaxID=4564 RepID=M7ZSH3_TRIUA|nr:receptor-like protein kinase 7 [Triticum urartu]EMS55340.1 LRR receptor-like serine/threonine-protein kinase HSL2 [Triticum urartu]KAF7092585.1 hypothetical protein CFC21_095055 [Triticum aestivum]VAI68333.1 unnamed protein product [Triticum turgidum subsp. durum]
MQFWSRLAAAQPIVFNEQAIVDNLTEDNLTSIFASRKTWRDKQVYLVHAQGIGTLVAKKFQNENPALQVDENVKNRCKSEMNLLANICHDNIIKVVDHIRREDAIMLVYRYPVNGSLQSWLHQPMGAAQPLSWPKRSIIATGVAQGLSHLHHGCNKPVVHHNISPNNILLDHTFKPVIAGFDDAQMNMARLGQPLPITDLPPGNFGYAAPEYGNTTNPMTEKVDTYSYGVLLLVIVTGQESSGAGADGHLANWARNC